MSAPNEAEGVPHPLPADTLARLIHKNRRELVERCRAKILERPELALFAEQLRIRESDEWLREAVSLFGLRVDPGNAAVQWHEEVGEINFSAGLSVADANVVMGILRDNILALVWRAIREGSLAPESAEEMVARVLHAYDLGLAAQASAYVRESQRHLSEANQNLEARNQMIARDLALATLVQQQFIPKSFRSEHFQAEVRYVPTTGVGGDHAGIFPVSPSRIYVTICDVTGHGVASALVAEAVSSRLRPLLGAEMSSVFSPHVEPVQIVRDLNSLFFKEFQHLGILLSFFIAYIDRDRGMLTYSGAGHPPPILQCCSAHNVKELTSQNIILGAIEDCIIGEGQETIDVHPSDRIIFYTDGIIEGHDSKGKMLGLDGLLGILKQHYETPPQKLADEILAAASRASGKIEPDDMSLILLDILD